MRIKCHAVRFPESLENSDESIQYRRMLKRQRDLQTNLYRVYGVVVPLGISDNYSDERCKMEHDEKWEKIFSAESCDAISSLIKFPILFVH